MAELCCPELSRFVSYSACASPHPTLVADMSTAPPVSCLPAGSPVWRSPGNRPRASARPRSASVPAHGVAHAARWSAGPACPCPPAAPASTNRVRRGTNTDRPPDVCPPRSSRVMARVTHAQSEPKTAARLLGISQSEADTTTV